MDREELIRRYENREIGRHEFISKLIEDGVTPSEAEGYADSIGFGSMVSGTPLAASAPMATSGGPEEPARPVEVQRVGLSPGWWGRLGFWPRVAILGGPLLLILIFLSLCVLRRDVGQIAGYGPHEPGPEESPRLRFFAPINRFSDLLGLAEVPQEIDDGMPGCKETKPNLEATHCTPQMDIQRMHAFGVNLQPAHADQLFGSMYFPCGRGMGGWYTACGSKRPPEAGPMLIVAMEMKQGFPLTPPDPQQEVLNPGVTFDSDGRAQNNYTAPADTPDGAAGNAVGSTRVSAFRASGRLV